MSPERLTNHLRSIVASSVDVDSDELSRRLREVAAACSRANTGVSVESLDDGVVVQSVTCTLTLSTAAWLVRHCSPEQDVMAVILGARKADFSASRVDREHYVLRHDDGDQYVVGGGERMTPFHEYLGRIAGLIPHGIIEAHSGCR